MAYSYNPSAHFASDVFSLMVPQPRIDRISIHGGITNMSPLKINVLLSLKDIVDPTDELISGWYRSLGNDDADNSAFEEFIDITIIQVTHPWIYRFFTGLASRQELREQLGSIINADIRNQYITFRHLNLKEKIPLDLDPMSGARGIDEFKHFDEQGRECLYVPLEETFKVDPMLGPTTGVEHLSYFVYAKLDMDALSQKLDISARFLDRVKTKTYVAVEKVIDNSNIVMDTNVYIMPDGSQWTGPVHHHSPTRNPLPEEPSWEGYMTGVSHGPGSVKLTLTTQPNPKIRDYRANNRVDERYRSVTQARIGAGLVEGEAVVGQAIDESVVIKTAQQYTKFLNERRIEPEKSSALFTDLYLATDEMVNGSGLFGFDYIRFLKEGSAFPWLWDVSGPTTKRLLALSSIRSMFLYRNQVPPKGRTANRLGTPYRPVRSAKYRKHRRLLGYTAEKTGFSMTRSHGRTQPNITTNDTTNKVRPIDSSRLYLSEVKIHAAGELEGIRWFNFTDRLLKREKMGTYQYQVHILSRDPTVGLLHEQYNKLVDARRRLLEYMHEAQGFTRNKPNYDIYLDRFIPEFIERFADNRQAREHYWLGPVNDYVNVLNTISDTLQQPATYGASYTLETTLPAALSSYTDPRRASPEGIASALQLFDTLLSGLREQLFGVYRGGGKGKTSSTSARKSHVPRRGRGRIMRASKVFDSEVVLNALRGKGYEYLTSQTLDLAEDSIKGKGLRMLSTRYIRKRCEVETRRFFRTSGGTFDYMTLLSAKVPDLGFSKQNGADSLSATKFTYLTPSFIYSSPGFPIGSVMGGSPSYSPPANGGSSPTAPVSSPATADVPGSTGASLGAAAFSYMGGLGNTTVQATAITPISSIAQTKTMPTAKGLDSAMADMLLTQTSPNFNLYPVVTNVYEQMVDTALKISAAEQAQRSKYEAILFSKGCTVVSAEVEFDDDRLMTQEHPAAYEIEHVKYAPQSFEILTGSWLTSLTKVFHINKIAPLSFNKNTYSLSVPKISPKVANLKATTLVSAMGKSVNGVKPATLGQKSPLAFGSVHVGNLNMLNFSDASTPNLLDTVNPSNKMSVLKALPNQLKSLVLNNQPDLVLKNAFASNKDGALSRFGGAPQSLDQSAGRDTSIFEPSSLASTYQLFTNIIQLEFLQDFSLPSLQVPDATGVLRKVSGRRPLLKKPQWRVLNETTIRELENATSSKVTILCRIAKYTNGVLGIGHESKMDLPVIDKYFILTVEPAVEEQITYSFDWGNFVHPTTYAGGSTGELAVDMDSYQLEEFDTSAYWRIPDPERPTEEILVREFDGEVNCSDPGSQ